MYLSVNTVWVLRLSYIEVGTIGIAYKETRYILWVMTESNGGLFMKHTFRYLVERDADFAIINAFEKNKEVRKLFLSGYRDLNSIIIETRHSFMQQEVGYGYGESDIIFILEDKKGKYAIFIEDKINADAQPSQRERYEIRAKQLKSKGDFED